MNCIHDLRAFYLCPADTPHTRAIGESRSTRVRREKLARFDQLDPSYMPAVNLVTSAWRGKARLPGHMRVYGIARHAQTPRRKADLAVALHKNPLNLKALGLPDLMSGAFLAGFRI